MLDIAIKFGAGDMNRTRDLLITNALLYLLSYTGARRRIIGGYAIGLKPTARLANGNPPTLRQCGREAGWP